MCRHFEKDPRAYPAGVSAARTAVASLAPAAGCGLRGLTRAAAALLAAFALAGCVNLKEVRDYAGQSSQLAAYDDVTARWLQTHQRESGFVIGPAVDASKKEDADRQATRDDLARIHRTVADYFVIMAKLAGDDTLSVTSNVDGLSQKVKAANFLALDDTHVDAYASVAKIVSNWISGAYQQREVARYIETGNAPIRTILQGMNNIVGAYIGTFRNEKARAGYLQLAQGKTDQDQIVRTLARIEYARIASNIDLSIQKAQALRDAIKSISDGHQKLYDARNNLSGSDVRAALQKLNAEIRSLKQSIAELKG
jgi:hypothetical protein